MIRSYPFRIVYDILIYYEKIGTIFKLNSESAQLWEAK